MNGLSFHKRKCLLSLTDYISWVQKGSVNISSCENVSQLLKFLKQSIFIEQQVNHDLIRDEKCFFFLSFLAIYTYIYIYMYIYVVFTTEGFLEVAIESWPEWDLNSRPLNSVQTL